MIIMNILTELIIISTITSTPTSSFICNTQLLSPVPGMPVQELRTGPGTWRSLDKALWALSSPVILLLMFSSLYLRDSVASRVCHHQQPASCFQAARRQTSIVECHIWQRASLFSPLWSGKTPHVKGHHAFRKSKFNSFQMCFSFSASI